MTRSPDRDSMRTMPIATRLTFPRSFGDVCPDAQRSHVEDAVSRADGVASVPGESGAPYLDLYTRSIQAGGPKGFVWLISVHTSGAARTVSYAFRAFPSQVTGADAANPVATLRAFADVYGIEAEWPSLGLRRFIEHEVVGLPVSEVTRAMGKTLQAIANAGQGRALMLTGAIQPTPSGSTDIRWSYAFDLAKYRTDLLQHGITPRAR